MNDDIQVPTERVIHQIEAQRNAALTQSAQCIAVIEQLQEDNAALREELAEVKSQLEAAVKAHSSRMGDN